MNFYAEISQKQTMNLNLTPNLIQAISLLQLSAIDLFHYVEEKANENPLIEIKNPEMKDVIIEKAPSYLEKYGGRREDSESSKFDFITAAQPDLQNHLIDQLRLQKLTKENGKKLEYLIYNLDGNGYLKEDFQMVCAELGVSLEEGEKLLQLLHGLEPIGVGARNLQECLLLQLMKKDERNELAETIIRDYIEAFANKSWKIISKELNVSLGEIQRAHDLIQTLNPRPGADYSSELPQYIVADAFLLEVEGELTVTINDRLLPKIQLHTEYTSLVNNRHPETRRFIKERYDELQWLLNSINQREVTLYKVVSAIVNVQKNYFLGESAEIKPLTLKMIAEETGLHESTISRTTSNKFIDTPKGIFELKHFFTNSISSEENAPTSLHVKELIREIVEKENKLKPLSDQKIVYILKQEKKIELSRRAVTKYRCELNILSSSKRKRFTAI